MYICVVIKIQLQYLLFYEYKNTGCPFYRVRQLSRDSPGDLGFLCNKPYVLRDNIKGTSCIMPMILKRNRPGGLIYEN